MQNLEEGGHVARRAMQYQNISFKDSTVLQDYLTTIVQKSRNFFPRDPKCTQVTVLNGGRIYFEVFPLVKDSTLLYEFEEILQKRFHMGGALQIGLKRIEKNETRTDGSLESHTGFSGTVPWECIENEVWKYHTSTKFILYNVCLLAFLLIVYYVENTLFSSYGERVYFN